MPPAWTRSPLAITRTASEMLLRLGAPLLLSEPQNWQKKASLAIMCLSPEHVIFGDSAMRLHMLDYVAQATTGPNASRVIP